jgi:hypothetical protein
MSVVPARQEWTAKIHKDFRTKTRTHGEKVKQIGTHFGGSKVCKGPNPLRNAGLIMPLNCPATRLPTDYLRPDQREVYNREMGKRLQGFAPHARGKYKSLFHRECFEIAAMVPRKVN